MDDKKASNKKIPSLNGLRAISIIIVLIHHLFFTGIISYSNSIDSHLKYCIDFINDGQFGVNVFFVISGFLITYLLLVEEEKNNNISIKKFYIRRAFRIFPAYYFLVIFFFILQLLSVLYLRRLSWITSLTFTKDIIGKSDWYTGHFWSLSVEEHFYLIWPFIFKAGEKYRKSIAIVMLCFPSILRFFLLHNHQPLFTYGHDIWHHNLHELLADDLTFPKRIDALAIGCLAALYKNEIIELMQKNWRLYFWISVIGIFTLPFVQAHAFKFHLVTILDILGGNRHCTIANIFIAFIMMYSIYGYRKIWFKFVNSKVMDYIGVLSYSIYLWQQFFLTNSQKYYNKVPFNLCFIILAALFSYYIIERPFLRLKNRFKFNKLRTT